MKNIFCIVVMYHDSSIFWKQFASNSALADIKCYSYYGTKWNVNTPGNSLKFVHFVVVNGLQHFLIVLWSNRKKDRLIKTFNNGPSLVRIFYENIYGFKIGIKTTYEHELFKTHKSFRSCVLGSAEVRWIILSAEIQRFECYLWRTKFLFGIL